MENSENPNADAELDAPVEDGAEDLAEGEAPAEPEPDEATSDEHLDDPDPELQAAMDEATSAEGEGFDKAVPAWHAPVQ